MHLRSEDLRFESRGTKKIKSAYKEVKKHGCINKCIFILVLHLSTLSV